MIFDFIGWSLLIVFWLMPAWAMGWVALRWQRHDFVHAMRRYGKEPEPRPRWERIVWPFRDPKK